MPNKQAFNRSHNSKPQNGIGTNQPDTTDSELDFTLRYSERTAREHFIKTMRHKFLVAIPYALMAVTPFLVTQVFHLNKVHHLTLMAAPIAYLIYMCYPLNVSPSSVQLGKEGIRLNWLTIKSVHSSPWINLDKIISLSTKTVRRGFYKTRVLDLKIDTKDSPLALKAILLTLNGFPPSELLQSHQLSLCLNLQAFINKADMNSLLDTLAARLPKDKLDPSVMMRS